MSRKTSVMMSTYNKSKFLDITLAGYCLQNDNDFELVIVNDGGTDDTEAVIRKYEDRLDIKYYYQARSGISRARNTALDIAAGDYIIVVDDDRIPAPEFVQTHKDVLKRHSKMVSIGAQFKVLSYYSNRIHFEYERFTRLFHRFPHLLESEDEVQLFSAEDLLFNFDNIIADHRIGTHDSSSYMTPVKKFGHELNGYYFGWSIAYGGNIAYNRSLIAEPPDYDLHFQGYGKEDVDLSYRLYLQGYDFIFSPLAVNYHQEHPRSLKENQEHFKNHQYFCQKHNSLEVFLHQLDHNNEIDPIEANRLLGIIQRHGTELIPKIKEYINRTSNPSSEARGGDTRNDL